jgi:uncharacterized C2H2 Zn-finger protein
MSDVKPAIETMKLHMAGAHSHLYDLLTTNDPNEEDHTKSKDSSEKKKEIDHNSDLTCPECFKLFNNKKNVKRHKNTALWTSETQLFRL